MLGALAAKEEDGALAGVGEAAGQARGLFARCQGPKASKQLFATGSQRDRSLLEGAAGGGEGEGDVGGVELGVVL